MELNRTNYKLFAKFAREQYLETMIEIEHLSKSYGDLHVLKDINASINKGDVISIIGPSGTGKSTFLRCLNLLERPDGGKIIIDGKNILEKNVNLPALRQRMGMVFQSFNLFEQYSVLDNLMLGQIKLLHKSPAEAEKRAMQLLHNVGLSEKAQSFPDELSGGQKQRVAIARCLSMDPEIILFDEPTSALDPTMVSEVLGVIRNLADEGMTMMIVTHEMNFAHDVSNRVFFMAEGEIYEQGTPDEIFESPKREITRIFINRIHSFEYLIKNANYDFYDLLGQVDAFSKSNYFSQKLTNNLQHVIEETLELIYNNTAETEDLMTIRIEYGQKKGDVIALFTKPNKQLPLLPSEWEETLSGKMLKAMTSSIDETENNGNAILKLNLLIQ